MSFQQQQRLRAYIQQKKSKVEKSLSRLEKDRGYSILREMPIPLLIQIIFNFPLLYAYIENSGRLHLFSLIEDGSYELLTRELDKTTLAQILKFLDSRLESVQVTRLNKSELFGMLVDVIHNRCGLSQFFIQDIFDPSSIFKETYKHDSYVDLFLTAFYYILQCTFSRKKMPLELNLSPDRVRYRFPMDIHPSEFRKPCILIDVANQFNERHHPSFKSYSGRVQYLKSNMVAILDRLFEKHQEPFLRVFFINQADRTQKHNCPEVVNVESWIHLKKEAQRLFHGTSENPFDRKVLYITVPCHLFLSPELRYPGNGDTRVVSRNYNFNTGPVEPGYPPPLLGGYYQRVHHQGHPPLKYRQQVKNVLYDRYGRMLHLPRTGQDDKGTRRENLSFLSYYGRPENLPRAGRIPYYPYQVVNQRQITPGSFQTLSPTDSHSRRYAGKSQDQVLEGTNRYQRFIKKDRECSGFGIHKNEIDDYMVGFLLLLHYKIRSECTEYTPFRAKWLLFSHDRYRWMNPEILDPNILVRRDNFLSYLESQETVPLYTPENEYKTLIRDVVLYPYQSDLEVFLRVLQSLIPHRSGHEK